MYLKVFYFHKLSHITISDDYHYKFIIYVENNYISLSDDNFKISVSQKLVKIKFPNNPLLKN